MLNLLRSKLILQFYQKENKNQVFSYIALFLSNKALVTA